RPRAHRQPMFFSATLDGEVRELARRYTTTPSRFEAGIPTVHENGAITHRFVPVRHDSKVETLVEHLRAATGRTLVFVRTKRGADVLVRKLAHTSIQAVAMHADLSQSQRQRALSRSASGATHVLVAPHVAARRVG